MLLKILVYVVGLDCGVLFIGDWLILMILFNWLIFLILLKFLGFILDLLIFWVNVLYKILLMSEFLLEFDIFVIIVKIDSGKFIFIFFKLLFLVFLIWIFLLVIFCLYLGILICFFLFKYWLVKDFLFFIILLGVLFEIIFLLWLLVFGFILIK